MSESFKLECWSWTQYGWGRSTIATQLDTVTWTTLTYLCIHVTYNVNGSFWVLWEKNNFLNWIIKELIQAFYFILIVSTCYSVRQNMIWNSYSYRLFHILYRWNQTKSKITFLKEMIFLNEILLWFYAFLRFWLYHNQMDQKNGVYNLININ